MPPTIRPLSAGNLHYVHQIDPVFQVEWVLRLHAENGQISYTVAPVAPYEKRYPRETIDAAAWLEDADREIYFAFVEGELAGQILLKVYWNNYAYIEDIVVERRFRKMGTGAALIEQAVQWARGKRLPGIMLETQNNNVAACRLYEKMGFELAGFDRMLYRGLHPETDEVALYWYLKLD